MISALFRICLAARATSTFARSVHGELVNGLFDILTSFTSNVLLTKKTWPGVTSRDMMRSEQDKSVAKVLGKKFLLTMVPNTYSIKCRLSLAFLRLSKQDRERWFFLQTCSFHKEVVSYAMTRTVTSWAGSTVPKITSTETENVSHFRPALTFQLAQRLQIFVVNKYLVCLIHKLLYQKITLSDLAREHLQPGMKHNLNLSHVLELDDIIHQNQTLYERKMIRYAKYFACLPFSGSYHKLASTENIACTGSFGTYSLT